MAEWDLIPCLKKLFEDFDELAPERDHTTDGAVGDSGHAGNVSDHNPDETGKVPIHDADKKNEVHAIDVDKDLRHDTITMEKVVQFLLGRCRSGAEKRLRYIIYNRRIWSASSGWVQKTYTGANTHSAHAHFSASYDTKLETSTASWHLNDIEGADMLSQADKDYMEAWHRAFWARTSQPNNGGVTSKAGRDTLDQGIPNGITGDKSPAWAAIEDIGTAVKEIRLIVLALRDQAGVDTGTVLAAIDHVDDQVLDALPGRPLEEQVQLVRALLGNEAADQLGNALVSRQ